MADINGTPDNDDLTGTPGDDTIDGLAGNDTLTGDAGDNHLDGGEGIDTVSYASAPAGDGGAGVNVDLAGGLATVAAYGNTDYLSNIENAIGSGYDDVLSGNDGNNVLDGGAGDDLLDGGAGDDSLIGGSGTDTVHFSGNSSDYTVEYIDGVSYRFIHNGADGADVLTGIEKLWFSDGEFDFSEFVAGVVPCFLAGTRLLTRHGYVPVESLQPGDEVQTLTHGCLRVLWLGRRHVAKNDRGRFDMPLQPIRISRDAFGAGLPTRDLWVSPDHAVFFRDSLIPAKALVNGTTVSRDGTVNDITYFHVLLERHAVVFSEGLPTESYVPTGNIDEFDNRETAPEILRCGTAALFGFRDCYRRVSSGPVVETARAWLAAQQPEDMPTRFVA
jgi:Ca2+-binding RTX toxin-like protein